MEKELTCKFCGKVCKNDNSLRNHERLCKLNPNHQESSWVEFNHKRGAWNKGKTKETDERVRKRGESLSNGYKSGRLKNPNLGKKLSQEEKDYLSKVRKEFLKNNHDKVPYILNHHSKGDSYPEKYFKDIFDKYNIKYEQNYYQLGYFLDFAWPDKKIYLEIDGEQHYVDKRIIKHDEVRTKILNDNGWTCVARVRWSEYQKMSMEEKVDFLNELLTEIIV